MSNDENNDDNSLDSDIDPQNIFCKLKEWTEWEMKLKKVKFKDWNLKLKGLTQTMKEWTTKSYILR